MTSFVEFWNRFHKKKGVFIELRFDKETINNIKQYLNDNNIQNPVDLNELHLTLLYSRKGIQDYIPYNELKDEILYPISLHIWQTQFGTNCLVCEVYNDKLIKYHNNLIKYHNASHDFKQFIPHITLSYDFKGDLNDLYFPDFNFKISTENMKSLDLGWKPHLINNYKK